MLPDTQTVKALNISVMTNQLLSATARPDATLSPIASQCLDSLIQGLEEAIAVLGWAAHDTKQEPPPTEPWPMTPSPRDHLFFALCEALHPPQRDIPAFMDELDRLRASAEKLREGRRPEAAELETLCSALHKVNRCVAENATARHGIIC